jgi:hypothetical protein
MGINRLMTQGYRVIYCDPLKNCLSSTDINVICLCFPYLCLFAAISQMEPLTRLKILPMTRRRKDERWQPQKPPPHI